MTTETKRDTIKYLTDLMATIQMAYFKKGMFAPPEDQAGFGCCGELWVHESSDTGSSAISIDLYNFFGDGKDVCQGLHGCTVTFDDGSQDTGWLFCMHYNPEEEETPLVFLFSPDDEDGDIDVEPDSVPAGVLEDIAKWLEGQFPNEKQ